MRSRHPPFDIHSALRGGDSRSAGNLKPADAQELITLLGTGDEGLRFRSAAELPGLELIVNWAKKARLVRKQQLGELSRSQREAVVRGVCGCAYPARETLEDFRVLVAEPILGASSRPRAVRNAASRPPRKGKRRGR